MIYDSEQIEDVFRLLRRSYKAISNSHDKPSPQRGSDAGFDQLLSNAVLEFSKAQGILWPLSYESAPVEDGNPIATVVRSGIAEQSKSTVDHLVTVHQIVEKAGPPLYLKGACWILQNKFLPQPWRYMADIDFLIPQSNLEECVLALKKAGYSAGKQRYAPQLHPHFPALRKPGLLAGIEVHSRCLRWKHGDLLEPDGMFDRAEQIETRQGEVLIPCPNDRIIHLVAHAQIASHRYRRRIFLLRDALELRLLTELNGADLSAVQKCFAAVGYENEFLAFICMTDRVLDCDLLPGVTRTAVHRRWVEQVIGGFDKEATLRKFHALDIATEALATLVFPNRWPRIVAYLKNWTVLAELVRRTGKELTKQQAS